MMEPALEGMPEPESLRLLSHEGEVVVLAGRWVLFRFAVADTGMRRLAMVALTEAGHAVKLVAEVFGVHPNYLSTLRKTAREQGSNGLVKAMGRPPKLTPAQLAQAHRWAVQGVTGQQIARRLQVSDTMISRLVGGRRMPALVQDALPDTEQSDTDVDLDPELFVPEPADAPAEPVVAEGEDAPAGPVVGSARLGQATVDSRYAGAMLLHAFFDRVGARAVFAPLAGAGPVSFRSRRFDDVALLTATAVAVALGVGSVEATKHLVRDQVGPLAGLAWLPELRTLRPRLGELAQACDPLRLQADLAAAMIAAEAPLLGLYFVDDHFVPYEGAKPVGKGYNTKRRHAQKGLADTLVTDYHGRAVCFVSGPPSGLTKTLPAALTELRRVTGEAKIMLGFDRGGAYAQVFRHCRDHDVDWITYRRGGLAATTAAPRRYWRVDTAGRVEHVTLADEMVTINDYGPARQLTLFEHDQPVLQVLTSDLGAPAAALLAWLRCRWRIENVFKYLTAHHGIDWLCHYGADIAPDTALIDNPARKQARTAVKRAETTLADAQRALTQLLRSNSPVTEINIAIPAAQTAIDHAEAALTRAADTLKTIPAKIPANQHDPNAKRAILATQRRSLQMVLRLLAFNAEQWLAGRLNTYLADNDEYHATLRHLLHLSGQITYTTKTITVVLDTPTTPKITRALRLLLDELNTTPPRIPGDHRPITYKIKTA
jgi:transcriptional regulator with XRE-family HTH domain/enamine deaminase RidA (YjgF/YER057c/UK114 family)